jgi:vitamin K-dependent gamma-carboxylase
MRYLTTHPDVVWQYAQILKERYAAKGQDVAVYAHIHTRLNTHPYRQLIDPEIDLGQVKWHHFRLSPWILR